ncbi:MAG: hypothetical protein ACD_37C00118G0004 [uncultured bacterium]|nr:MAG: hypothetical protein ACD_37C00118G0004 [uncultured bacterium]
MSYIIELPTIPVMCSVVVGVEDVSKVVDSVEEKLGHKLTGRKCFGVSTEDEKGLHYRACVAIRDEDNPASLGLEVSVIPGGKYAKDRIRPWDYRKDVPRLIEKFEKMAQKYGADKTRPSIEFYRRHDDLILYLPIK